MSISGPCFCPIKGGRPFNKYEVVYRTRTPKGLESIKYYFDTEQDAELYLLFLYQQEGLRDINKVLSSTRTYFWEKEAYKAFKESIDWEELPAKIKNIKVIKERVFVEIRGKK